jgi:F420-non-reducing hydrogenase iron-sulfur subunit
MTEYEPKLVGFLCNWCSYAGADLAGVSRFQYPPNLRVIRVMCSGRVHPAHILEAFRDGADGVLVAGCHIPTDCHYISGNFKAQRRVAMVKKLMEQLGIEPERLRLEWISAAEGEKFAKTIREMTEDLKKLGPSLVAKVLREAD